MPLFLGIPLWAWVVGGGAAAAVGGAYVAGEAAEKAGSAADKLGDAAEPVAEAVNATTKLMAVSGVLAGSYLAYRHLKK